MSSNWLSNLPSNWKVIALKRATELKNIRVSGNSYSENYIGLEHIESWTGKLINSETEKAFQDEEEQSGTAASFEEGDILFGKLRPYLAKAYLARSNGICTTELLVLKPTRADGRYLLNVILTNEFIEQVNSTTFGARMPRADWNDIGNIPIPIPPLPEQRAIADYLDRETTRLDSLIVAKERLLELLAEKRRAVITHAITRGLNSDVSLRDSGVEKVGKIPEHWQLLPVKFLANLELSNVDKLTVEGQEEVRLCNYVDVYKNERITSKIDFMRATATDEQIKRLSIRRSDVLLTKDSETPEDIGVPALVDEELENVICGYHLALLRPNKQMVLGEFLFRAIESNTTKSYYYTESVGMTRYGLDKNALANTPIPFPSIEEQKEITGFINKQLGIIDKLAVSINETKDLLHKRRASLIAAAVSGQIKIT